jgi:peptide/nickel transport system substrate-binding protein
LLAEAGYADGLDVTLYTSNLLPPMVPLAEVYQQQAAEAGINVTIEQVAPDQYVTDIWGVEPLFIDNYTFLPADFALHLFYGAESLYNATSFDNAELAQLLAEARAAADPAERTALYQQAQELLYEESVTLIPFHQTELHAFSNDVSGVSLISRFDMIWHEVTKAAE